MIYWLNCMPHWVHMPECPVCYPDRNMAAFRKHSMVLTDFYVVVVAFSVAVHLHLLAMTCLEYPLPMLH